MPPRRVLFSVRTLWYMKFFESAWRELAGRGHQVHVIADEGQHNPRARDLVATMEALARENPGITFSWTPERSLDPWADLSHATRRSLDYLRFFEPQYERAPILRRRAAKRAPWGLGTMTRWPRLRGPLAVRTLEAGLDVVDRLSSQHDGVDALLEEQQPDAVIVSPLVTLGSAQFDVLRAAQRSGIPTALAVASWDHLSSKALIRTPPDRVLVWNEVQRREAIDYHGLAADRVVVTGAQCFDEWFERRPSTELAEFCARVGLPADRPIVLYVCSALFEDTVAEAPFVEAWVTALRQSADPVLRQASVLVRPHPKRGSEWDGIDLSTRRGVAVWPRAGEAPIAAAAKQDYFDSLYHATAVVGLNTSAQIEAGIIGRPVYTVLLPEFWDNQEGTLHFKYLLEVEGGLLHAARSLDEHCRQLAEGLRDPAAAAARNTAFVRAFVRPHEGARATSRFAAAVEELASLPRAPRRSGTSPARTAGRMLLRPAAWLMYGRSPATAAARRRLRRQQRLEPVPLWLWRLRFVAQPLARWSPHVFGSEQSWRASRYAERQRRGRIREAAKQERELRAMEARKRRQEAARHHKGHPSMRARFDRAVRQLRRAHVALATFLRGAAE